ILPVPKTWGGELPDDKLPDHLHGYDPATHRPKEWPLLFAMAHWATVLPALTTGEYTLRARTIDAKGIAQPMPRPFLKSGRIAFGSADPPDAPIFCANRALIAASSDRSGETSHFRISSCSTTTVPLSPWMAIVFGRPGWALVVAWITPRAPFANRRQATAVSS